MGRLVKCAISINSHPLIMAVKWTFISIALGAVGEESAG